MWGLPGRPLAPCVGVVVGLGVAGLADPLPHAAASANTTQPIAARHYDAYLEPDLEAQTIRGVVTLTLNRPGSPGESLSLDRGALEIESVEGDGHALPFETPARHVVIRVADARVHPRRISIRYRGAPRSGLVFVPDRRLMYTVFATSQWMVVHDAPHERATLRLRLVVPRNWTVISNGRDVGRRRLPGRTDVSEWRQDRAVPTYTFGFVAGELATTTDRVGGVAFRYAGASFSRTEMRRIFTESARMVAFFERRSGVRYPGRTYTQVIVPRTVGQEMAGFSVISEDYARAVLSGPVNGSLLAHELAHQWWGNMVTCRDWTECWLNEGFATFLAAAYREERFGRATYLADVDTMRTRYEQVRNAGRDRSLVFPDWSAPTTDDRTLVYQKGGYVLHRLRELLGDDAFWNGFARYTTRHVGQSVTTVDFQRAMEEASRRDLGSFFAEWVYASR